MQKKKNKIKRGGREKGGKERLKETIGLEPSVTVLIVASIAAAGLSQENQAFR